MAKYIGLMSGTSMDGVDAVLCDVSDDAFGYQCKTLAAYSLPYPDELLNALNALCVETANELNTLAVADRLVAEVFAEAVHALLAQENLSASDITAIGSHGQTIRHHPDCNVLSLSFSKDNLRTFTCQIGDANTLAVLTGIDVVADFRKKDIALGGQGAPLVPAYHNAVFAHPSKYRILVNIGGIANITVVPPAYQQRPPLGFDTGPGNTLMDNWIRLHLNEPFDSNGNWAAQGRVNQSLLNHMLSDTYFSSPFPKSTGREYFNIDWLSNYLSSFFSERTGHIDESSKDNAFRPVDIQATLLQLTAKTITNSIQKVVSTQHTNHAENAFEQNDIEVIVCGGGTFNSVLMNQLASDLACKAPAESSTNLAANSLTDASNQPSGYTVLSSDHVDIHPQHVEGAAFAWLAFAYLHDITGNVPQVTGASRAAVLGALYKKN
ncbi:MAG: anhydro-N-acetylmuramic acid kinase [Alteromonas sp.]|jgi:anhydro-N-acetylmuramic acid kinase|uniref:anhydro-N-acetylmuramic acid kinase n=1 Tax=Alteromonas sp. TaxID=232 RepID=UPI0032D99C56